MSEAEVEAHNRRSLWQDVATHLRVAGECVEWAQGVLEDLDETSFAEGLQPLADRLGTYLVVAEQGDREQGRDPQP